MVSFPPVSHQDPIHPNLLNHTRHLPSPSHCTYLLTSWCRVLLEKLTGLQLVKKFPAFHGTRRFITSLTTVRHLSLSWASPIQSIYPHPTCWRSILVLFTQLRLGLPSGLFPSGFPPRPYTPQSPHPYAPHAQPISFSSILSPVRHLLRLTNYTLSQSQWPRGLRRRSTAAHMLGSWV